MARNVKHWETSLLYNSETKVDNVLHKSIKILSLDVPVEAVHWALKEASEDAEDVN